MFGWPNTTTFCVPSSYSIGSGYGIEIIVQLAYMVSVGVFVGVEGTQVGVFDGELLGVFVGIKDGAIVGVFDGELLGLIEGFLLGMIDGDNVAPPIITWLLRKIYDMKIKNRNIFVLKIGCWKIYI